MARRAIVIGRTLAIARHPMVERYGFALRFVVLFAIWGNVAFDYKLLMDQTPLGVVISLAFFTCSITTLIGYKTRTSLLVFAGVMLVHAYIFHHMNSVVGAVLALAISLLPVGACYSVDRYLKLTQPPVPYEPSPAALAQPLAPALVAVFVAFVIFNFGGPAYNQIFLHNNKYLIQWHMFHTVGSKLINVHFFRGDDRAVGYVDYAQLLGHKRTRYELFRNPGAMADLNISSPETLDQIITRVCRVAPDPASLRLDARMATEKSGWLPYYTGEHVCDSAGLPLLKPHMRLPAVRFSDEIEKAL